MNWKIQQAAMKSAEGAGDEPMFVVGPKQAITAYRDDVAKLAAHGVLMALIELGKIDPDFDRIRFKLIDLALDPSGDEPRAGTVHELSGTRPRPQ